jgi:hypothetical protein
MMTAADSRSTSDTFATRCAILRRCIGGSRPCSTEARRTSFQAETAYFKMGSGFKNLKRNYEAAAAYEKVFTL